jgi:hypothetical protein
VSAFLHVNEEPEGEERGRGRGVGGPANPHNAEKGKKAEWQLMLEKRKKKRATEERKLCEVGDVERQSREQKKGLSVSRSPQSAIRRVT